MLTNPFDYHRQGYAIRWGIFLRLFPLDIVHTFWILIMRCGEKGPNQRVSRVTPITPMWLHAILTLLSNFGRFILLYTLSHATKG